jgi:dethiobiotin synthetase
MNKAIGIAGIHTGVGKTIVSAILAAALEADYWKPVQAGYEDGTDTLRVKKLLAGTSSRVHEEHVVLTHAMSPHAAAALEDVDIHLTSFHLPATDKTLIVETAGGLLSPLNERHAMLDLLKHLELPVIVVCNNYLGSINHTMLTLEVLQKHNLTVLGLIFNGEPNEASERFIVNNTHFPLIARIPFIPSITPDLVRQEAAKLKPIIKEHYGLAK